MHYVQELVNSIRTPLRGIRSPVGLVYQKKRRGDGFQSWHQDLVGNGTTAATIVVNIDSIVSRRRNRIKLSKFTKDTG
jgi:hypothetical protein